MADRSGQRLGNYQLLHLLAVGGFAEVYLGEHLYLKTQAAIKVMHTRLAADDLESFLGEARTIARLAHPHIVRVLEFGVAEGTAYLVMDYAPNGTLRQRHPRGTRLPLQTILPYVQQVAQALQHAHQQKYIHRDVKPENMLIGRHNEVLLSDFGIATVAQTSIFQGKYEMAGTVAYMAPEQVQGHPRPASDLYSLGVVVYEWLAGERPFRGSFTEIAAQQVTAAPVPLRQKLPALAPEVEEVVMIALAKDPKDRFASVRAFAHALEQASKISLPPLPRPTVPLLDGSAPFGASAMPNLPEPMGAALTPPPVRRTVELPPELLSSGFTPPSVVINPTSQTPPGFALAERTPPSVLFTPPEAPVDSSALTVRETQASLPIAVPGAGARPPKPRRSRRGVKIVAVVLTLLILLGTGGGLAYLLTRPQPVITLTTIPAASSPLAVPAGTILAVDGQDFAANSAITFLLAGQPAPDALGVTSDAQGNFKQARVTITDNWPQGTRTFTARDAQGNVTKSGVSLTVIPNPSLTTFTSKYHAGDLPAGAAGTSLHIEGKHFTADAPITFLLDGQPAPPDTPNATSNADGGLQTDLIIPPSWPKGKHTLEASDNQGYVTASKWQVLIVTPGKAGTPGPNGAPPDNASFTILFSGDPLYAATGQTNDTLTISGQASPNDPESESGSVCQNDRDGSQPRTITSSGTLTDPTSAASAITYTETLTTTCSGTYEGGHLSYTETVTSDTVTFVTPLPAGVTCALATPNYVLQSVSGSYGNGQFQGTWSSEAPGFTCIAGYTFVGRAGEQGIAWSFPYPPAT